MTNRLKRYEGFVAFIVSEVLRIRTASACSAPVALMVSWIEPTEKNEVLSLFMMELPTRVIKSPGALLVSGTIVALCPSVTYFSQL